MNPKIFITALAIAVGTMGFSPVDVDAKPKKVKKVLKKLHKQSHKGYGNHYNNGHYGYHRGFKIDHDYPDYERESYGIYSTPGGGLGFYYSESEGPAYGYGYPYDPYGGYGYY